MLAILPNRARSACPGAGIVRAKARMMHWHTARAKARIMPVHTDLPRNIKCGKGAKLCAGALCFWLFIMFPMFTGVASHAVLVLVPQ